MTREELEALLGRLAPDLETLGEPWAVIGSAAMMLAGVDWPDCADLDIVTTGAGAERLESLWSAWRRPGDPPPANGPFRSRFARFLFPEGAVETMGDLEIREAGTWRRLEIVEPVLFAAGGGLWPAPGLAEQAQILRRFGRPKDLAKARHLDELGEGG
jgi:hypothetical protein